MGEAMKISKMIGFVLVSVIWAGNAWAGLVWLPGATDATGGAEYTIKRVWEYYDGNNVIMQVEVNEAVANQGCTGARANTLYMYSVGYSIWQQQLANKLTLAQLNGYKIKMMSNVGSANWCHAYGLNLLGVEVIVPPQS